MSYIKENFYFTKKDMLMGIQENYKHALERLCENLEKYNDPQIYKEIVDFKEASDIVWNTISLLTDNFSTTLSNN